MTSQIGYLKLLITRRILSGPLDFEIKRVACSSNTKYFYDWSISDGSNTPISNYFLTVRTKEEFTVKIVKNSVVIIDCSKMAGML